MNKLEMFHCKALNANLSRGACASNHKESRQRPSYDPIRKECQHCPVGEAHSQGRKADVDVVSVTKGRTDRVDAGSPTPSGSTVGGKQAECRECGRSFRKRHPRQQYCDEHFRGAEAGGTAKHKRQSDSAAARAIEASENLAQRQREADRQANPVPSEPAPEQTRNGKTGGREPGAPVQTVDVGMHQAPSAFDPPSPPESEPIPSSKPPVSVEDETMPNRMKCKRCGREFQRTHGPQQYCQDCREADGAIGVASRIVRLLRTLDPEQRDKALKQVKLEFDLE